MLYNLIIDDSGIDRHEHEPFVMPFYTGYTIAADAEKAARRAVEKYLKTPEGLKSRRQNCGYFNWGDVACNVPDRFYIAEGLFPVPTKEEMSTVVMHDEDLVGAEDEYTVTATKTIDLTAAAVTRLIEKAVRAYNGSRYTFSVTCCADNDLEDHIWDIVHHNKELDLYENENGILRHALSVSAYLDGFRLWYENGFDTKHAVLANGFVKTDAIPAEEADRILRFALLNAEEAFK